MRFATVGMLIAVTITLTERPESPLLGVPRWIANLN
jgi:hypothetical protein